MGELDAGVIAETVLVALLAAALLGCAVMLLGIWFVPTFAEPTSSARPSAATPVTILKPLHGNEPGLFESLASFCAQDYAGPIQIIFGVTNPNDPAIRVVERLRATFPGQALELVVDSRAAGLNPKVANLVNMSAHIRHELVVLADSDIEVKRDYLVRVVNVLERSGGAVTCAYYGIAGRGVWSQLARLNIDSHFLPGVVVGARCQLTRPCFGATIALSRHSLAAIGGFEAFADCLADDFALGEAMRKIGEPVTVLPFAVGHRCNEQSLAELWGHELRWASTIRVVDPLGYLGWVALHPLPLALLAVGLGGGTPAWLLALSAIACRALMMSTVERCFAQPPHSYWMIPLRDLLSFAVYLSGFVAKGVSWRGRRYGLLSEGTLVSEQRSPSP